MRTTVTLPDLVYDDVRVRAAQLGRSVSSVIEEAVRVYLLDAAVPAPATAPPLPTMRSGGARPGIDLDDMSTVREILDEHEPIDAVR